MGWMKLLETRKPDCNVVWRSFGKLEELILAAKTDDGL
jgi:hypothetical protein